MEYGEDFDVYCVITPIEVKNFIWKNFVNWQCQKTKYFKYGFVGIGFYWQWFVPNCNVTQWIKLFWNWSGYALTKDTNGDLNYALIIHTSTKHSANPSINYNKPQVIMVQLTPVKGKIEKEKLLQWKMEIKKVNF